MGPEAIVGAIAGVSASEIVKVLREGDDRTTRILTDMLEQLTVLRAYSNRQSQRTLYPIRLSPNASGVGATFTVDSAMRGSHLAISGAEAGDIFGLRMGSGYIIEWNMGTPDYKEIDLPMRLTPGTIMQVVNITDAADATWRCYLWAEQDRSDISHGN